MYSIKAKPETFGHPNKQALTLRERVLRKTLWSVTELWAIYLPTFVVHISFRMAKLQDKRLGIQINDLSLDDI